ncbi:putative ribonuclease H-like domain-containing protein [Tanacetum coccineum]
MAPYLKLGFLSAIYEGKTHQDLHTCLFACFLSQEEPKRVSKALSDPAWVEAMQEELLQFKLQNVWVLVDLPKGHRAIGTKWVYRNKKDERGIVCKEQSKTCCPERPYTRRGIDYDEVFAPVARIEAIRIFLAYASFMGFTVYQMDVKSAFLYGQIEEEVYVCQPPGFEDPDHPDKVYKVVKALYGNSSSTLELDAADVDEHLYRSMIGSLMYLTASRPDIMFAVCACASHYLIGSQPLEVYILGNRLISWQCKKQTVVATSTTEAEYVAAANCCGQCDIEVSPNIYPFEGGNMMIVLTCWLLRHTSNGNKFHHVFDSSRIAVVQSKRLLQVGLSEQTATAMASPKQTAIGKDSSNPFMAEFCDKHNMVAYLEKSTGSAGFHPIIDFITRCHIHYALTKKPEVCVSFIRQFWRSAEIVTDDDGSVKIHASIDGHSLSISEGSLRRHLKLDDQDGITSLPPTECLPQLALMGYVTNSDKLTFQKGAFSPQWRFLIHNILHCLSPKKTAWEQFSSNIAVAVICLATDRKFNFSRMIFDHMVSNISSPHKFLMYPRLDAVESSPSRSTSSPSPTPTSSPTPESTHAPPSPQPPTPQPSPTQPSPTHFGSEYHPPTPHDSPLHAVHSHGSDEGSLKLQELMTLINILSDRVGVLEADLTKTKQTYSSAYTKLILRVKKLEAQIKVGKARRHSRFVLSDAEDDSSKQGRKFSMRSGQWKIFSEEISTAGKNDMLPAREEVPSLVLSKKKSKKELEQERLSFAEAIRIEEQMHEEQRAQIARDAEIARQWDEEERKRVMDEAKATKKIDWNDPSVLRYHSLKLKPKSIAQARRNMVKYLKNQGNFKMTDFKGMSYNEVRPIFEKLWDFNQKFVPLDAENASKKQMSPEKEKSPEKIMKEKAVTQEKKEEVPKEPTAKRKKSLPRKTTKKRQKLEDVEKDELKGFLDVVPREETPIEIESLSTKFPIVDWKTVVLTETFMYYQVFRGDGSSKKYKILSEMLQDFDMNGGWNICSEKKYPLSQEMLSKMFEYKIGGRYESSTRFRTPLIHMRSSAEMLKRV